MNETLQRLAEQIKQVKKKKNHTTLCYVQKIPLIFKDTNRLKVNNGKDIPSEK